MLWMCWRQFRVQLLSSLVFLAGAGTYLFHLGTTIRDAQSSVESRCQALGTCAELMAQLAEQYENKLLYLAALIYLVPVALGMFWGAPLVAGEFETGTHRLVWNQGVTRSRWLLTKVAFTGGAAVLVSGFLSALMTWAAEPIDTLADNRFMAIKFGARHVVPIASTLFAVGFGTLIGVLLRRRMPAMALTGALAVVTLFIVPTFIRPHLMPPTVEHRAMTAEAINAGRSMGSITGAPRVGGLQVEDAWVTDTTPLLRRDGTQISDSDFDACYSHAPSTGAGGTFGDIAVCLSKLDLHADLTYQPNSRYWAFQTIESGGYLAAFLGSLALALARLRRSIT